MNTHAQSVICSRMALGNCLQAYYAKYDEQVNMNEVRYAKGNAKDYTQHSHPVKASSATVRAIVSIASLPLPTAFDKPGLLCTSS